MLLHHGADANLLGGMSRSALQSAVMKGNRDMVYTLLNHGADVNLEVQTMFGPATALTFAAACGLDSYPSEKVQDEYVAIVQDLLDHGTNVNFYYDHQYGSALYVAKKKRCTKVAKLLEEHGALDGAPSYSTE